MSEPTVAAQPDMVPGSRSGAGTMFAALYGELTSHPWHDPEHDAYLLFYQRSEAMGWLDDSRIPTPERPLGLWGMNDAGWEDPRNTGTGLVSWFQVEVNPVAGDRPLPVQPFLRCAQDATMRAGTLDLSAVQVLLPVQGLDPALRPRNATVPAIQTAQWFHNCDPRTRTAVRVSINSGRDSHIPAVAPQLIDFLARLDQEVFVCQSHKVASHDDAPPPPFDDSFWNGPPLNGLVLHGRIVEWSCDAIGWLAAVIADSAAHLGVRSPVLFTITRSPQSR